MKLTFLTVVIALAFLSGCTKTVTQDKYDSMESSYEQQISDLESKVASKQQYIETVNTSIQELSSDVNRFEHEDWRDVVPDVYDKIKALETNIQTES